MLKTSSQKQRKYPSPTSHAFSAMCVILNAGFLIIARSRISAKPLSCLMLLDISNSTISIPADSTHLLPLVSELFTLNYVNATKKRQMKQELIRLHILKINKTVKAQLM